ncbi:unnamed protein product [Ectocarpus sp. 6 AP-2014]
MHGNTYCRHALQERDCCLCAPQRPPARPSLGWWRLAEYTNTESPCNSRIHHQRADRHSFLCGRKQACACECRVDGRAHRNILQHARRTNARGKHLYRGKGSNRHLIDTHTHRIRNNSEERDAATTTHTHRQGAGTHQPALPSSENLRYRKHHS